MAIGLVLADDHPLVLKGLEQLFHDEHGFKVLACCTDGEATLLAVREHRPDVLVTDIRMPLRDGIAVLREIKNSALGTRVVFLAGEISDDQTLEAIRLGVHGVVLKEMPSQLLVRCVRKVHAGGRWIEKDSIGRVLEKMLMPRAHVEKEITVTERRIVGLVAQGLSNKEVAQQLHVSEGTVKVHLHSIYVKLGVSGRRALTKRAREIGLIR